MKMQTLVLLSLLAAVAAQEHIRPELDEINQIQIIDADNSSRPARLAADHIQVELCDCEPATGEPGGLSCEKEGFFIASFERQGQWVAGGGSVPLSRAICCRPCLPSTLPDGFPKDDEPLAVVSIGCHASTDTLGVRCEQNGNSFVSGFTDSIHVFASVDTQYPIDTAQCCTPALLMSSGDAWELERCNCGPSLDSEHPVNCGGNTTNQLLAGFDFFRLSPLGQIVPIGPSKCCGACLSNTIHPATDCSDLNHCSGNGVCLLGRCECLDGWGSSDCSQSLSGKGRWRSRIPAWAVALITIGSCILAMAIISAAAHLAELVAQARERSNDLDDDDGDGTRPLLLRIDADDAGSVGSQDTDECEEEAELEEVEERIETVIHRLEEEHEHAADGEGESEESTQPITIPSSAAAHSGGGGENNENEASSSVQHNRLTTTNSTTAPPTGDDDNTTETALDSNNEAASLDEKPPVPAHLQSYMGVGPLSQVDCVVCMIRPVQTVVVPCGHVCMCRRCSRRLNRCPICRKEVVRRQRLYV